MSASLEPVGCPGPKRPFLTMRVLRGLEILVSRGWDDLNRMTSEELASCGVDEAAALNAKRWVERSIAYKKKAGVS